MQQRIEIVEATVAELVDLGASVQRRTRQDDPPDPVYFVGLCCVGRSRDAGHWSDDQLVSACGVPLPA
jgi:hypothetical protein